MGTTSLSLSLFLLLKNPRRQCQVRPPTTKSTRLLLHLLPSRRTPNITVEYFKLLRHSIKRFPRKAEVYATATKDPFVPSTQAPGPPSSRNASEPSRSQQKATLFVPPTHSQTNRVNLADFYADPNPNAVLGTGPTAPLDGRCIVFSYASRSHEYHFALSWRLSYHQGQEGYA
jgi:hypothetical protein